MKLRFQCFQRWITLILLVVLTLHFGLLNFFSLRDYLHTSGWLLGFVVLGGCLVGLAGLSWLLLYRIQSKRQFILVAFGLAIGLRLLWIFLVRTPLASDYLLLHTAATEVVRGEFVQSQNDYFVNWVYQIGYVLYEAVIIRLFGTQLIWLKLLNVGWFVGTLFLLYRFVQQLYTERAARLAVILYAFYPPSIFLSSVTTNDYISTFFFYLGIYYLLCKTKSGWYLAGGLAIALGNILRPLGSLILLALVLYIIFYQLLFTGRATAKRAIVQLGLMLVSYFVLLSVFNLGIQAAGISDYPLGNRNPTWKIVIGLNRETDGAYSAADGDYLWQFPLGAKRDAAGKQLIQERTADKADLLQFIYRKYKVMWTSSDSSLDWALADTGRNNWRPKLLAVQFAVYWLILFATLCGSWRTFHLYRHQQQIDWRSMFFVVLIFGYSLAHLILEIQTRYRFFIIPAFLVLAGSCWPFIVQKLKQIYANQHLLSYREKRSK